MISASTITDVSELENTQVHIFTIAVVNTGGKYCASIFPFTFNGATQLATPFSDCNTKSGASPHWERYIQSVALISSAITSQVLTVSLSTCPVTVIQFPIVAAPEVLRVQVMSTLPTVSNHFKWVVPFTVKSSVTVASPETVKSLATDTSSEKIASPVTVWFQVTVEFQATDKFPHTEAATIQLPYP